MVVESAVSFISMVLVTLDSTPPAEAEEPRKVVGLEDHFCLKHAGVNGCFSFSCLRMLFLMLLSLSPHHFLYMETWSNLHFNSHSHLSKQLPNNCFLNICFFFLFL